MAPTVTLLDLNNILETDSGSSSESRSNSPQRSPSASPTNRDASRSPSPGKRERSGSRSASRSASGSPQRASRSRSGSPEKMESPQKERSRSRSRSGSGSGSRSSSSGSASETAQNKSPRSPNESPARKSRSASREGKSPSGSPEMKSRSRSTSVSPARKSGSGSPERKSKSGSPKNRSSRSRSASGSRASRSRSRSATPQKGSRSGSANSARQSRSRSGSPKSAASRSGSERSRSGSGSPKKRKRPVLSDSGSETERQKKQVKQTGAAGSDAESGDDNLVIDAEALFGDASDISSEDEAKNKLKEVSKDEESEKGEQVVSPVPSEKEESEGEVEGEGEKEAEVDETHREAEPPPETRIDVEIPKISTNLGREIHFVKLPNFLSVETRPFDPETYEDEIDEEETLDEEGRARLKLKVENTIRWREIATPEGLQKQSNARIVRWSDGSLSLHLGSEIFDVYKQPLQGDHNHLFVRQGTGLQGQAVFRTKLTFRPHSTESFTHRKMTMSLADRSLKTTGIKVLSLVGKDPEANRGELIKKEEEKLRATVRRESRQRRIREKGASRGLSASYLEPDRDDSDDEGISISAIKRQHKNRVAQQKGGRPNIYSSDEEASDIETRRARRLDKAKAIKDSDSDELSAKEN